MAITFVNKAQSATLGTGNAVVNFAAAGTGDLIVGSTSWGSTTNDISSIKDNNGVSATIIDTFLDVTNSQSLATFYFKNVSGAPTSITVIYTGGAGQGGTMVQMQEWSGIDTTAPLDGHNIGASAANPHVSPVFTTTVNGDLIYGALVVASGFDTSDAATSPFVTRNADAPNSNTFLDESQIQSTASATTQASFTSSTGGQTYNVGGAAFKAAGGDTLGGAMQMMMM